MSDSEKKNDEDMADAVKSSPSSSTDRSVISATRQPSSNSDGELDSLTISTTENGATHQSSSDDVIDTDKGQSQFSTSGGAFPGQPSTNSVDADVESISTCNVNNWLKTSNEVSSERQVASSSAGTYGHIKQSEKSLPQTASQSSVRNKKPSKISGSNNFPYKRKSKYLGGNAQSQKLLPRPPTIFTGDRYSPKAIADTLETKSVESESSWNSFHSNYFLRSRASSDTSSELRDEFYPFTRPFHSPTDSASNYRSQYECQSRPGHSSETRVDFEHSSMANFLSQTGYLLRTPISPASTGVRAESFQGTGDSQRMIFSSSTSASRNAYLPIGRNAAWYTGRPLIALSLPSGSGTSAQSFQGLGQFPFNATSLLGVPPRPFYPSTNLYRSATSHIQLRHSPKVRYNVATFTGLPLINFKSSRNSFRCTTPYEGSGHFPKTSHEVVSPARSSSRTHHSPRDTGYRYGSHSEPKPPVELKDNKSKYEQSPEASHSLERPVYHDRNQRELRRTVSNPETSSKASECNVFSPSNRSQEPEDSSGTETSHARSVNASQVGHPPTAAGDDVPPEENSHSQSAQGLDNVHVSVVVTDIVSNLNIPQINPKDSQAEHFRQTPP